MGEPLELKSSYPGTDLLVATLVQDNARHEDRERYKTVDDQTPLDSETLERDAGNVRQNQPTQT